MTITEMLEGKEESIGSKLHHVQALINGLDGRPQDWVYEGEWFEDRSENSYCACGHWIVYNFVVRDIKNKANTRNLGSVCIETYSQYRPDDAAKMKEQIAKIQEDIANRKKAGKQALQMAEVEVLIPEYIKAYDNIVALIAKYREEHKKRGKFCYLMPFLYGFNYNKKICKPTEVEKFLTKYAKIGHQISYLKKNTELMNEEFTKNNDKLNNMLQVWGGQ